MVFCLEMVRATMMIPTTPIVQTRRQKLTCNSVVSPPTPHRIQLRNDENNYCKKPLTKQDNEQPVPKTRRFKNGQATKNQLEKVNHKLTEYFPIRRSVRKTKSTVLEEKQLALERAVRNRIEDNLEVRIFEGKGRGVIATKDFQKGDFVVEYWGDLIDVSEAKQREEKYADNENAGCYMYYFKHNGQQYCIDATAESGRLGRLVNHSRNGNLTTKVIMIDKKPRLVLIAKEDIIKGEEVLYDYGDRSKESLKYYPWLAY